MITALKIFNQQIKRYKPLGLAASPYKHFFKWRKSLINGANSVKDELPWITFNAIDYLQNYLKQDSKVLEYGGGGSTLFFLKNKAHVFTVEHDENWFKILEETVKTKKYPNWKGFFVKAQDGHFTPNPNPANPLHYGTADETYKNCHFKNYASAIDSFENGYFDVVLVDGRARPSCIHHAISKIKKNGLLVLDNSDRKYYLEQTLPEIQKQFTQVIADYAPSPYSKDFTHTIIWIKNK